MAFRKFLNLLLIGLVVFLVAREFLTSDGSHPRFTQPLSGEAEHATQQQNAPEPVKENTAEDTSAAPEPIAQPKPEHFATAMHYAVTLSGFPVADIYASLQSLEDGQTEIHVVIKSTGIADIAGGYKTDTRTIARYDGGYFPVSYHTQFKLKGDWRTIKLLYDEEGNILQPEYNEPPEKRWKRKEVSPELKHNTLDPLTIPLAARQRLKALRVGGDLVKETFRLPLYDGRRRSDIVFDVLGKTPQGDIALRFTEVPVAGYTDNELAGFQQNKHVVQVEISPDALLPVRARGDSVLGDAEIILKKQCNKLEACMQ